VSLKLLSYNIRFGGLGREDMLARAIKQVAPDLVVFQEAIHPEVIERLAHSTGLQFWAARKNHSIGYISRTEITYHEWHYPAGARHPFLEIVPSGSDMRIFGLHLSARFSKWDERRRAREIRALLEGIKRHQEGFHVLVGDFNTLAPGEILEIKRMPGWIRALIWISGRQLQRETIQFVLNAGYVDGYRTLHKETAGYTFPTWDPRVRLDYVFVPKAFSERLIECDVIIDANGVVRAASDHCPLMAQISLNSVRSR
jgi:exodeoxyribonuclease III